MMLFLGMSLTTQPILASLGGAVSAATIVVVSAGVDV